MIKNIISMASLFLVMSLGNYNLKLYLVFNFSILVLYFIYFLFKGTLFFFWKAKNMGNLLIVIFIIGYIISIWNKEIGLFYTIIQILLIVLFTLLVITSQRDLSKSDLLENQCD